MEALEAILSAPVLFAVVAIASFALVAKAIVGVLRQLPSLSTQLEQVQRQLSSAHEGIPQKRAALGKLHEKIKPLKLTAQHLQDYSTTLLDIERKAVREEEDRMHREDIPIHRPGAPRDI